MFDEFRLKNRNKKIGFKVITLGAIVLSVCIFAVSFISLSGNAARLKQQKAAYTQELAEENAENERLSAILQSDNRDEYIEQKAREKGYVKSGEIVFYDVASGQ